MSIKEVKIIIVSIVIGMIIGCIWQKSYFEKDRPLLSERLELCESQGGKYQYYWDSYQKTYIEECKRIPGYIDLDQ